jgi:hypothetical protein
MGGLKRKNGKFIIKSRIVVVWKMRVDDDEQLQKQAVEVILASRYGPAYHRELEACWIVLLYPCAALAVCVCI